MKFKKKLFTLALCPFVLALVGCSANEQPGNKEQAPQIASQPSDLTVPLGLSASFNVTASGGTPLAYQWQRNGANIAGANSATYSIQSTSSLDSQSTYDVIVSNGAGAVTSRVATLTLGARSPSAGDLRFQQVDSVLTYNGYTGLGSGLIPSGGGITSANSFSLPLPTGPSCNSSTTSAFGCSWWYETFIPMSGTTALSTQYTSAPYASLSSTLSTLLAPNNVVTGMDLEPNNNSSAFTVMTQNPSLPSFTPEMVSNVQPSDLLASISARAAAGKVVTAISYDVNGTLAYIDYGWQSDSNQYDVQIATASLYNGAAAAQTLAAAGYILTAVGGNEYTGVVLVGTRVHGDTLPRPFLSIPATGTPTSLSQQGYATVALFYDATQHVAWVGER